MPVASDSADEPAAIHCDAIIVGAGPAGCFAAMRLHAVGLHAIVLQRNGVVRSRPESLPPRIAQPLLTLGLWQEFLDWTVQSSCRRSSGIVSMWGSQTAAETNYYFDPYGTGWHIDRQEFDGFVHRAARARGCRFVPYQRIVRAAPPSDGAGWRLLVQTDSGPVTIQTQFVIDAGGRGAPFARDLGTQRVIDDPQVAMLSPLRLIDPCAEQRLVLESTQHGWWYRVPVTDGESMAGFVTDADILPRESAAQLDFLLSEWNCLQLVSNVGDMAVVPDFELGTIVPATCTRLVPGHGDNWMAVGDSALSADPLSGQGLLIACVEGIRGAQVISERIAGRHESADAGQSALEEERSQYLQERQRMFDLEKRWPTAAFWQRRHRSQPDVGTFTQE